MSHDKRIAVIRQRPQQSAAVVYQSGGLSATHTPAPCSLYVHIPFCFHKCHYCDFYSIVDTRDRQEPFIDRLERELVAIGGASGHPPLTTIFVGGGTPSLLRPPLWRRLLTTLDRSFDLSPISRGGEFTVECNPETVTSELAETLASGGVTRISMGAQSFNRTHLATLERHHDPDSVPRALDMIRRAGITRDSIDLIFAIPGQTLEELASDLRTAISLGTRHLSCYALTYEPGTAMTARLARGEFTRSDEELEAQMMELTLATLRSDGLDRYEVSNFAAHGEESLHNLAYWRQANWFAAGPAASGHFNGRRWRNSPRLDDYLDWSADDFSPIIDHEAPDAKRNLIELVMTSLRLREGLDLADITRRAESIDPAAPARMRACVDSWLTRDLVSATPQRITLTDSGFLIADALILDLVSAIDP